MEVEEYIRQNIFDPEKTLIYNPIKIGADLRKCFGIMIKPSQEDYMISCASVLFRYFYKSDGVMCFLPGWRESTGCLCELGIALAYKLELWEASKNDDKWTIDNKISVGFSGV